MRVLVGSMFRDAESYIGRYRQQVDGLAKLLWDRGDDIRLVLVENDSIDNTPHEIHETAACGHINACHITVHDDCPYYPSVNHPHRWRHLAWVANHVLDEVSETDDRVLYVESDLAWDPHDMLRLIDRVDDQRPAWVAPNWHQTIGGNWYDSWGTRGLDGRRWSMHPPHHSDWQPDEPFRVESMCGAIALSGDVARSVRFQPQDCFVGLCRDVRQRGHQVWCDPTCPVVHS